MSDIVKKLENVSQEALRALEGAAGAAALEKARVEFLGAKGRLT